MADIAKTHIRWMRKLHPVVVDGTTPKAAVEIGVRVVNAGSETWTVVDWRLGAHVLTAAGDGFRDVAVTGNTFSDAVPPGTTVDLTLKVLSAPDTDGLASAALLHPHTLIVVDVVHEDVAWLGNAAPGHVGQRYVSQAFRDAFTDAFDAAAARNAFGSQLRGKVTVPTSGVPLDVVYTAVPSGQTHYLLAASFAPTTQAQRLTFKYTPSGGSEQSLEEWVVPVTGAPQVSLYRRRMNAGDQYRVAVDANASGGQVLVVIERLVLPWEEEL